MKKTFLLILAIAIFQSTKAEANLSKIISIHVSKQRLALVLEQISHKGNFYFSYNSNLIKRDSLVSIEANQKKVRDILDMLFNKRFEYKESGNYVIIRPKPEQVTVQTKPVTAVERYYSLHGYVFDGQNGLKLTDVSVYEKTQLIGSLTDYNGYFNIKLKSKYPNAQLTVSREMYRDTTISVNPELTQEIKIFMYPKIINNIVIAPEDYLLPDSLKEEFFLGDTLQMAAIPQDTSKNVESKFLGRWFVSTGQKLQSLNLGDWFTERPFQLSITPGLSTHGKMSGQVINNLSLNVFGGYTGGVKGVEIGGLFNINRRDVVGFQAGGLFNHNGGQQTGFQAAGISNSNLGSGNGFQASGVVNYNGLGYNGFQAGGVANINRENHFKGFQAAGVYNHGAKNVVGVQVAGVSNFAGNDLKGIQIGGVFNYTKHNKGVQIGLINYADTSDGYSIGLINVVRRGYHKWYIGTDETMDLATSIKTGNKKMYSILLGGMNLDENNKLYAFGYGIGSEFFATRSFALSTDLSSQYLYLGSWDYLNLLNRFAINLHLRFSKHFAIYGGASLNAYYSDQTITKPGYAKKIPANGFAQYSWSDHWRGWGGWHAGLAIF